MVYTLPQVRVFQEREAVPSAVENPLYSFIFGPNFHLFRYADEDEKILAYIGPYDYSIINNKTWPNKPAGAAVDQAWTRLFFDDAWLQYFRDYIGIGHTIRPVVGYPNRIHSDTITFASYGIWSRSADFRTRDVRVGDGVIIRATACGEDFVIRSRVTRLVHDLVAAAIGTPTADANNAPNTSEACSMTQEAGDENTVNFSCDASGYDGTADGDTVDTYYLTVDVGGGFGVAQLQVTSASGHDDPADSIIPQNGIAVDVGIRGLQVTFTENGYGDIPFEEGQIFRVDVNQNWVQPTIGAAGTYIGTNSGTYVITVTKGGLWADEPQVFVTSTGTLESSGPYAATLDGWITLPSGVRFQFSGTPLGLSKNDRYYIAVTAAAPGPIHGIEIQNSLPDELFGICYPDAPADPVDLDLTLCIIKDVEIPRTHLGLLTNWITSATQISINPNLVGQDSSWVDNLGNLIDMPIIAAEMYVQYRAWRRTFMGEIGSLDDIADVLTALGPITSDNPLALAVFKALQNSNGTLVKFMATDGDDLAAFSAVLDAIYDREDVYGLVPLTYNQTILDAIFAHVNAASTADRGRWRVLWAGSSVEEETAVLTEDSYGNILYATIGDDPDTAGTQYTRLRCDEANFIVNNVQAGQTVRIEFFINPVTGLEQYSEYIIDEVLTEEELRLATGPTLPITVPSRMEVWKTNSKSEIAQQVIVEAGHYSSLRARLVFPDRISDAGAVMDSIYICAALAGLRSGVLPHQGLTNVEINGFDDVSRATNWLGGALLDSMAENGVWIVTQEPTGMVYSRHQLTTDMTDVNTREDSLVSNFDSLSYRCLFFFRDARYIGRRNITPGLLDQLAADFDGLEQTIILEGNLTTLGPQALSMTLEELYRHPTLLDRLVARVGVDMPEPFNNFDITLVALAI